MLFAFVDENENQKSNRRYTSATAAVFSSSSLAGFRADLIRGLSDLFFGKDRDRSHIDRLPVLHASSWSDDISDEKRLATYEILFQLAVEYDVRFFRVGYFDDSVAFTLKTRAQKVDFCLVNIVFTVQSLVKGDIAYVYELSHSIQPKLDSYNDAITHEYVGQSESLGKSISIENYERIVAKLYCDKHNHFMCAADFVGYALCLEDKTERGHFQDKIARG